MPTLNFEINKEKTCCFSGHRNLEEDFNCKKLIDEVYKLIEKGYDTFLVGMALGFDTVCFSVLENIRKQKPIKIYACIPCKTQAHKFSFKEKEEYAKMLNKADKKIYLSQDYTPYCMMQRNMFMIDNSSVLITYLRYLTGGTYNTNKYAKNKGIKIIEL